jgi:hypothetical protein
MFLIVSLLTLSITAVYHTEVYGIWPNGPQMTLKVFGRNTLLQIISNIPQWPTADFSRDYCEKLYIRLPCRKSMVSAS